MVQERRPFQGGESRRAAKNGSPMTQTANGTSARVIPLMTPPSPTCSVNQAAERARACRETPGPSASGRSGARPHRARAAETERGRARGSSAVTAAIGRAWAKAANWAGSEVKGLVSGAYRPTTTVPTR